MGVGLGAFVVRNRAYRGLNLSTRWRPPRPRASLETLKAGLPIGASIFMEASLVGTCGLLMAQFGGVGAAELLLHARFYRVTRQRVSALKRESASA